MGWEAVIRSRRPNDAGAPIAVIRSIKKHPREASRGTRRSRDSGVTGLRPKLWVSPETAAIRQE